MVAGWIRKTDEGVGSIFYAEQILGGRKAPYTFTVTKYLPYECIEYTAAFPQSLLFPGGSFIIKEDGKGGGSIFTATLTFRFGFLAKIFRAKMGYVRKHVSEEGQNLKRLLEGA